VTARAQTRATSVELIGGLRVSAEFSAHATGPGLPYDVTIEARYEGGRFRVLTLTTTSRPEGEPVTTEGLRKVPVGRIMQQALEKLVVEGEWQSGLVEWGPWGISMHTRPKGPDEDAQLTVAALYRFAHLVGVPPTAYVAETLGLPKSTAGRWVGLARKSGHLGPALGTKAGEGS
jgi:hypothetical protein